MSAAVADQFREAHANRNSYGTSSRSPRSNIVPDLIGRTVPSVRQCGGLRVHQVLPFATIAALAQTSDEFEHLAHQRVRQRLDLFVDLFGERLLGLVSGSVDYIRLPEAFKKAL
jgi:hypothetical protein